MARTTSFEPLTAKIGSGVWAVGEAEKKKGREGKGRKSRFKKAFYGYISRICGDGCTEPILMKFGRLRDTLDVINRAEFHLVRISGFWLAIL